MFSYYKMHVMDIIMFLLIFKDNIYSNKTHLKTKSVRELVFRKAYYLRLNCIIPQSIKILTHAKNLK